MATKEQYDAALAKAERSGYDRLNGIEKQLVDRLKTEHSARGNRARKL